MVMYFVNLWYLGKEEEMWEYVYEGGGGSLYPQLPPSPIMWFGCTTFYREVVKC